MKNLNKDTMETCMLELQAKKHELMQEVLIHPMTAAQRQQHTIQANLNMYQYSFERVKTSLLVQLFFLYHFCMDGGLLIIRYIYAL